MFTLGSRIRPNFNPRSPRRERLAITFASCGRSPHFNPRSPRRERLAEIIGCTTGTAFQSTLPAKGATRRWRMIDIAVCISIHAPREGSDGSLYHPAGPVPHFNPRSPRRERPHESSYVDNDELFQSTLPAKGATCEEMFGRGDTDISIHAPREGSDEICGDYEERG